MLLCNLKWPIFLRENEKTRTDTIKMEEVNITEPESRYFSDLFAFCDTEKTGKIHPLKATEMFRSSDIPDDVLDNVCLLDIFSAFSRAI